MQTRDRVLFWLIAAVLAAACNTKPAGTGGAVVSPVYNQETGKLEQLVSDRNGDGKLDTRAFMDGAVLKHIEIDRDNNEQPDRWEYYDKGDKAGAPIIRNADEANGPDNRITRREFYESGVIKRVIDDTNFDGRPDKWETYEGGTLARIDLDLVGRGFASQRLIYNATGDVTRVETDPDGDGVFVPVSGTTE